MKRFNLSEWAITHRALVLFMILVLGAAGAYSYVNLGRAEDPSFTIKTMVVNVAWPGATATEMQTQVADKIEKKLQELPYLDRVESYSQPGVLLHPGLPDRPDAARQGEGALVPGPQEGRRHQGRPAGRRRRTELQRRIRRRLFGDLHAERRRPEPRRPQDARRGHPPAAAARSQRQQGRHHRRAAAEDLHRAQPRQAGDARHHARSRSSTASPGRTPSPPAARSTPRRTASICASPARSPASTRSRRCRCRSMAACSGSATSRRSSAATRTPPTFIVREGGKPALGLGVSMQDGANIITLGEDLKSAMERDHRRASGRHRGDADRRPAAHRRAFGFGVRRDLRRGARHRAAGELPVARLARRHRGRAVGAAGARDRAHDHVRGRHRPSPHHARRADHRARASGRRRHHRHRDDGGEDGAGLGPRPRRDLRLDLDRVSDADRHAGHRRGLPAGRLRQVERGRICRRHFLDRRSRADRLVGRGGAVHALSRPQAAARSRQARRRTRIRTRSTTRASIARCAG